MSVEQRLADAIAECERLREENRLLREQLGSSRLAPSLPLESANPTTISAATVTAKSSPKDKIGLFRSLFRGREDVYAVRWEGYNGKVGYSPPRCRPKGAPFSQVSDDVKQYFPLTDQIIHDHLSGKLTVGVYPLLADESCWFLASDFDKAAWKEDVTAFLHTCADWNIPAALEILTNSATRSAAAP